MLHASESPNENINLSLLPFVWFFFYACKKTPFINIFYSRLHILTPNFQSQFFAAQFIFQHCSFYCSLLIKVVEVRTATKLVLDDSVHSSCDLLAFWFLIACLHLFKWNSGIIQEALIFSFFWAEVLIFSCNNESFCFPLFECLCILILTNWSSQLPQRQIHLV